MGLFPSYSHTRTLKKLPVVFQSSESLVVHIFTHGTRNIFPMERGGVLVLAMVKFSKSPKTSKSSLSLMGRGGLSARFCASLIHHKNFSFCLKTSKSLLFLIGGGFWYLQVIKFSKFSNHPNHHFPQWGEGFGAKFGQA